jgi:solute carrier family 66, member 2
MNTESILAYTSYRVFYWFGAYYDKALLVQAALMIVVQLVLLKVALDNRPPVGAKHGLEHAPFSGYSMEGTLQDLLSGKRPFNFWRWPNARP